MSENTTKSVFDFFSDLLDLRFQISPKTFHDPAALPAYLKSLGEFA
jgi:hypothetical protein